MKDWVPARFLRSGLRIVGIGSAVMLVVVDDGRRVDDKDEKGVHVVAP